MGLLSGIFRRKPKQPQPSSPTNSPKTYDDTFGDAMVVSMIAAGAEIDELHSVFPHKSREELQKIVKKACDDLGLFPD